MTFKPSAVAIAMCVALFFPMSTAIAVTLTADTSRPNINTFVQREAAKLTFTAAGLPPGQSTTLSLDFHDEHDTTIGTMTIPVTADSVGQWTGEAPGPAQRCGFYRVFGTLADGTKISALGTRPAGFVTYAVVPDPATRIDDGPDNSMFGMQGGFSSAAPVIPYLGVRWTGGGWGWDRTEPDHSGQFDEQRAAASAKGQTYPEQSPANERVTYNGKPYQTYSLATVNGVPKWAAVPAYVSGNSVLNEAGEIGWAKYCSEIGAAFPENYPKQTFHPYQLTWEPAYPWNWKGTDAQLVRIYEIGYTALHKADHHAVVLGPTNGFGEDNLFKAGLGRYIDGFSIHNYVTYPPEQDGYVNKIRTMQANLRRYCGRDIPIFGTEQGHATGGKVDDELTQALSNVRDNLISLGEGFKFNYAFYVADYPGEPGYGYYYNLNPKISFGTDKIGPKPSVPAYAAMTYLLDGHRPVRTIEWLGPTVLGYSFQRGEDIVIAVWDYSDKPGKVTIPVGVSNVTVYDWMGNGRDVKPTAAGQIDVSLSAEPIYVRGVSPAIWGKAAIKPLTVSENRLDVFPGQAVTIHASVAAAQAKPGDALLILTPSPQVQSAPTAKTIKLGKTPAPVRISITLPKDIPAGPYTAQLTLNQNGTAVGAAGILLNVRAPLAVVSASPQWRDGKTLLECELKNRTTAPIAADITVRLLGLPGEHPHQHAAVGAGQTRSVSFDCTSLSPDNNIIYTAQIDTITDAGYRSSDTFRETFAAVPHAPTPPSMDAGLDQWAGPAIELSGRAHIVRSPDYYNGELKSRTKLAWDAANLYAAFDVVDPVFIQDHDGWQTWKGDCLQLEFNLDPDKRIVNTGNQAMDNGTVRTMEIDVALTAKGPQAYRTISFDATQAPVGLLTDAQASVSVKRSSDGLIYRMAIPWKTLGAMKAPEAGQRIGFSAYVNDMSRPDQLDPTALGLFATTVTKDPANFGTIVLLEDR